MASAASSGKSLSYCRVVVVRLRRFANDTGVPDCHIAWESIPLLQCNWKKMFSRLLSEEKLVAEGIRNDSLPNWENAYNAASAYAYTCKFSKTLLEAASEALDGLTYARYQNYTDVRFARLERTGALRLNRKSRGVDDMKKLACGESEAAIIDCRYDALWQPYNDDTKHMAAARMEMQKLYPDPFRHRNRGNGPSWKEFELERVKALWINDALREPGMFRTKHIETLKSQKRSNMGAARYVKSCAETNLARLKAKRKAINAELTLLGCTGYDSSGSDVDS
ncbi:hypothetical protein MMC27_000859 [Xylographa pallens]|nr:hypothetical protein [Xylographa pallens]